MSDKLKNADPCTTLRCNQCGDTSWYIFVFKDMVEFHCKNCDDSFIPCKDLLLFCQMNYKESV